MSDQATPFLSSLISNAFRARSEIFWVVLGQAFVFIGGILGIKVLTNVLGPEGYGELGLGMALAGALNMFFYGPLSQYVMRFYSIYRRSAERSDYIALLKKSHVASAFIVLSVTALTVSGITMLWGASWALLIALAGLFAIVNGQNGSLSALLNVMRNRKAVALNQVGEAFLRPLVAITFVYMLGRSGRYAMLGFILVSVVVTVSQLNSVLKDKCIRESWRTSSFSREIMSQRKSEFWAYTSPFLIYAALSVFGIYGDRLLLQSWVGTASVGIYVVMYQIGNAPITLLLSALNQLLYPVAFKRVEGILPTEEHKGSVQIFRYVVGLSMLILVCVTVTTFFFGEQVLSLLTSSDFTRYHQALWVLILGLSMFHLAQQMTLKGFYQNQPKIYILPKAIQTLTFFILAFLLGQHSGVNGIAVAFSLSAAFYLISVYVVNSRLGKNDELIPPKRKNS